jgi:hypothetical protein
LPVMGAVGTAASVVGCGVVVGAAGVVAAAGVAASAFGGSALGTFAAAVGGVALTGATGVCWVRALAACSKTRENAILAMAVLRHIIGLLPRRRGAKLFDWAAMDSLTTTC